jgi:hypothetical protein
MANSVDFRSNQIQTSKIIVTGSSPEKTLLIYGIAADGTPANQGNIGPTFDTSVIGKDVFLFVSGVIGGKDGSDLGISVFGGDLHISGNLTVDGSSPGGGEGTNFFTEINATSIYTTSSVAMPYLSSSTGAQITGSLIAPKITGSIQYVDGASTTAFITSSNFIINYNSSGQWELNKTLYASDGVASFGTGNASITGLGDASTFTLSGSASSIFAYNTLGDTTAPKIIWSLPVGARKITMYTRVTATNGWTTSASNRYFQTVLKYAGDGGAPTTVLFGFGINGGNNAYTGDKRTGSNQGSGPYSSGPGFFELTTTDTWLRVIWDLEQQVMTYAFGVGTHTTKPTLWKTGGTGYIYATSAGGPWPVSDDAQIVASIESFDSTTPGFTLTMQPEIIVE